MKFLLRWKWTITASLLVIASSAVTILVWHRPWLILILLVALATGLWRAWRNSSS
jgi:uncharacterized membrane protein